MPSDRDCLAITVRISRYGDDVVITLVYVIVMEINAELLPEGAIKCRASRHRVAARY